jgi:hypothetical protein
MKFAKIFGLLFFFTVSSIFSQYLHYGFKTGIGISKFSTQLPQTDVSNTFEPGFVFAGFFELDLGSGFNTEAELGYTGKGNSVDYAINDSSITSTFNLNYLDFQIHVKYYPLKSLYVYTGVNTSIILSATVDNEIKYGTEKTITSKSIYDYLVPAELSMPFGIGYVTPVGLLLEARFNLGLTNIVDAEFDDIDNIKNMQFAFIIGFRF